MRTDAEWAAAVRQSVVELQAREQPLRDESDDLAQLLDDLIGE